MVGKAALDALDNAGRVNSKLQERVDPLIERSATAKRLRDRLLPNDEDLDDVPIPETNASPFKEAEKGKAAEKEQAPLAKPELPAQVFGAGTDPWTGRALQILTDYEVEHEFVDLEAEDGLKIETRLVRETGQDKPPFIFLRGELIGGYNALSEIQRLGQLEERTKPADERSQGKVRIVIPKREGDEVPPGEVG